MATLPPYQPPKTNPRVNLDALAVRKFIWNHGIRVLWEQASECPCARRSADASTGLSLTIPSGSVTGGHRTDCPVCGGEGYYRHSDQEIVALITNLALDPQAHMAWGEGASGMVKITTLPENLLSFKDRITLLDSVLLYRETLPRKGSPDALRYPIVEHTMQLSTGDFTAGVLHCHKADASGETTLSDVLVEGTDFDVVDGKIDWTKGDGLGSAPAVGDRYSVSYFGRPRYVVTSHPFSIRDTVSVSKVPSQVPVHTAVHAAGKLEYLGGESNGF